MPTPRPCIITVAGPVSPFFAIPCVGDSVYEVQYSVNIPIKIPANKPMMIAMKILSAMIVSLKRRKQHSAEKHTTKNDAPLIPILMEESKAFKVLLAAANFTSLDASSATFSTDVSVFTNFVPSIEHKIPKPEIQNGRAMALLWRSKVPVLWLNCCVARVHAAIIEPT